MKTGTVTRRCYCTNPTTGKEYGATCPKLKTNRRHGAWTASQMLEPAQNGKPRRFRRGGFDTATKAQEELDKVRTLLAIPDADDDWGRQQVSDVLEQCIKDKSPLPDYDETRRRVTMGQPVNQATTVGEWLDAWLAGKKRLRRGGAKRYETDVRVHLKPHLGHIRLDRLRIHHITTMFEAVNETNLEIQEQNTQRRAVATELKATPNKGRDNRARRLALRTQLAGMPPFRRATGPSTQHHIRDTLRAALNTAIAQQAMPAFNPAAHVELASGARTKPLIWTRERIARWQETGVKPSPVMVWTPDQTATFLDSVSGDRLYMYWRLVAFRGMRRGESCAIRWEDYSAAARTLTIATQLVQDGWEVYESTPKTAGSHRTVALDAETDAGLQLHRARQEAERAHWGSAWQNTGRVFTEQDGGILHPGKISDLFDRLVRTAGLPPIRLHDLRHVAATLMLAAGVDVKVVSETLGHTDTRITRDIYQSVLDDLARDAAEKVAALVPHQRPAKAPPIRRPEPATTPDPSDTTPDAPHTAEVTPIDSKRAPHKRTA